MPPITIGYECEYFVEKDGTILRSIPIRYDLLDGVGDLIEVRSAWYVDPTDTATSFESVKDKLEREVKRSGMKLLNLDRHDFGVAHGTFHNPETAGFHIHFARPDGKQMPLPLMIDDLTKRFKKEIGSRIDLNDFDHYRMKQSTHGGWEYRLLPATIDVTKVTEFLKLRLPTWEHVYRDIQSAAYRPRS